MIAVKTVLTTCLLLISFRLAVADSDDLQAALKAACLEYRANKIAGTADIVHGRHGWLLLGSELAYLSADRFWGPDAPSRNRRVPPQRADPLPAIVDLHRQLDALGIELLLLPVPVREMIYPESVLDLDQLPPRLPHLHPVQDRFYEELRSQGVQVIDLSRLFLEQRNSPHAPLYCRTDAHWTSSGTVLAAKEVARLLGARSWYQSLPKTSFVFEWQSQEHAGLMYQKLQGKLNEIGDIDPDQVHLRRVSNASGKKVEHRNPGSPIILLGDSNGTWWRQARAGLPEQLAYELSLPVDVLCIEGGGATDSRLHLVRTLQADPSYLDGKRAVIWCLSARSFTSALDGWLELPLR